MDAFSISTIVFFVPLLIAGTILNAFALSKTVKVNTLHKYITQRIKHIYREDDALAIKFNCWASNKSYSFVTNYKIIRKGRPIRILCVLSIQLAFTHSFVFCGPFILIPEEMG